MFSCGYVALSVSSKVRRDALAQREPCDAVSLIAVAHTPIILAPGAFLRVAEQVRSCDMMMVPSLGGVLR